MKDTAILRARGIHKSFKYPKAATLLKGIDLEVLPGQSVAIMGRSGEGKSTLLQILGTLENPCCGELEIAGQKVSFFNKSKIRNQKLAFIFQSFHLLEDYTVLENVLMPARIGRVPISHDSAAFKQAIQLLEQVGLRDRIHYSAKLLSGGEKQRVAIARALSLNPTLILADEPSGNLDRETAHQIHELLLGFVKGHQRALVVVTHDPILAQLCDRRLSLVSGKLLENSSQ